MSDQRDAQDLPEIRIDAARNVVLQGDREVALEPKAMDVLGALARAAGNVVSVDTLIREAWPGRIVEDSSVHRRISQIRSALGDAGYVETIPKRGYRLAVSVHTAASDRAAIRNGTSAADGVRSIALFPFQDLSPDGSLHWLAEGLSVHLRGQLARARRLKVLPGALTAHRQADRLPADTQLLIDGHVQLHDEQVHLGLEVIDLISQSTLWQDTFTSALADPYEIQTRISTSIARLFRESLRDPAAPTAPAAFLPYLKYLYHRDYSGYDVSRHWLEQTLLADSAWATGRVQLALLCLRGGTATRDAALIDQGRQTLCAVLDDPDAGIARGLALFASSWLNTYWQSDLAAGEAAAAELAHIGATTPYANLMLISGLVEEAHAVFAANVARQPHNPYGWEMLMEASLSLGDVEGAVAASRRLLDLFPENSPNALLLLAWPLAHAGATDEVAAIHDQLRKRLAQTQPGAERAMIERGMKRDQFALAMVSGDTSRAEDAAQWFADLGDQVFGVVTALRLGDQSTAERLLATPLNPDFHRFWWWKAMTLITEELEAHPLIRQIRSQLGFTPEWRAEMARRTNALDISTINCNPARYALPN